MTERRCESNLLDASKDWVRRPAGIIFWWVLPLGLGVASEVLHLPLAHSALLWAVALAWMGTGCAVNALRCRRRHCFISGPVLWLGAIVAGLVALGLIREQRSLAETVNATLVITGLSFLADCLWGPYAGTK